MGNQQPTQNTSLGLPKNFKDWIFVNETFDSRYGQIRIYSNEASGETICYVNRSLGQANLPRKITRQEIDHPNIVRLYHYEVQDQSQLCSTFQKVTLIYEYLTNDLAKNIQLRTPKKNYYSEKQLWGILSQLLQAVIFLQQSKVYHRDLIPSNILITISGVLKLWDVSLLNNQLPGYAQVMNGIREEIHLSPEELLVVRQEQKQQNLDPEKCDIFQIGLTILEASSLEGVNSIYDGSLQQIDFTFVEQRIKAIETRYGFEWVTILRKMLSENATDRGTFVDYLSYIPKDIELNLVILQEEAKKQILPKESEQIWYSPSQKVNVQTNEPNNLNQNQNQKNEEIQTINPQKTKKAEVPIEDMFNTSQNQSQYQDPQQQLNYTQLFNQSIIQQQQTQLPAQQQQNFRRNSQHSLQNKEMRFISSRPPSALQSFRQLQQKSGDESQIRKKSLQSDQQNEKQKESFQTQMKEPNIQNNQIKKQSQENLLKEPKMKLQFQSYDIYKSPPSHSSTQVQTNIKNSKENNQSPPSSYQINLQKYQSPTEKIVPQTQINSYNSPPTVVATNSLGQTNITRNYYQGYNPGVRNVCQNVNPIPIATQIKNNHLDQKIEEVLQKSKQALARFNSSIQGTQPQRQPLNSLVKNDLSNFVSSGSGYSQGRQSPPLNYPQTYSSPQPPSVQAAIQIKKNSNEQQPIAKYKISDDYISKILAQAHYEIQRSQQQKIG